MSMASMVSLLIHKPKHNYVRVDIYDAPGSFDRKQNKNPDPMVDEACYYLPLRSLARLGISANWSTLPRDCNSPYAAPSPR